MTSKLLSEGNDDGEWAWGAHWPQLQAFERELRCLVCKDFFDNAVVLSGCGHTCCSKCLRASGRENCVACKKEFSQSNVVPNRVVQSLVVAFKSARPMLLSAVRSHELLQPTLGKANSSSAAVGAVAASSSLDMLADWTHLRRKAENYHTYKDKQLKGLCLKDGLLTSGGHDALLWRHKMYVQLWNAACDGIEKPEAATVRRQLQHAEADREKDKQKADEVKREKPKLMDFSALGAADIVIDVDDELGPSGPAPSPASSSSSSAPAPHGGPVTSMAVVDKTMTNKFAKMQADLRQKMANEKRRKEAERAMAAAEVNAGGASSSSSSGGAESDGNASAFEPPPPASQAGLPDCWVAIWSMKSKRFFFYNSVTKEGQYEVPADVVREAGAAAGGDGVEAASSAAAGPAPSGAASSAGAPSQEMPPSEGEGAGAGSSKRPRRSGRGLSQHAPSTASAGARSQDDDLDMHSMPAPAPVPASAVRPSSSASASASSAASSVPAPATASRASAGRAPGSSGATAAGAAAGRTSLASHMLASAAPGAGTAKTWSCTACTYINQAKHTRCQVCSTSRPF